MSRKSLGKAGRTVTLTVKITQYEAEHFERKYGTPRAGIRAAIDKLLPESVNHPGRPPKAGAVINTQDGLFTETSCGPRLADHPGWTIIARGPKTKTVIKACRVCGERVTERE